MLRGSFTYAMVKIGGEPKSVEQDDGQETQLEHEECCDDEEFRLVIPQVVVQSGEPRRV